MNLIRILLFIFLLYLLYKLFFRYVGPYIKHFLSGPENENKQHFNQNTRYQNMRPSSTRFGNDGEYVDYEEVN